MKTRLHTFPFWSLALLCSSRFKPSVLLRGVHLPLKLGAVYFLLSVMLSAGQPKPVLIIKNDSDQSYRGVLDWDCPVFSAYSDGVVIWRKGWACSVSAFSISHNNKAELIVNQFTELAGAYGGKVFALTSSSDPEETAIWCGGKSIVIKGDWRKPHVLKSDNPEIAAEYVQLNENERKLWSALPAKIRDALTEVAAFDDVDAKRWQPEKVVVTLEPGGLGDPVAWPSSWPQNFVFVPGSQIMKRVELPGSMLDQLLDLLTINGRQPRTVLLAGERRYGRISFLFP